jgi:hypothetical protein
VSNRQAGLTGTPACSDAPTPSNTDSLAGTGAQYSAAYSYDSMNRLISSPLGAHAYGVSAPPDAATVCVGTQTGVQLRCDNEDRVSS